MPALVFGDEESPLFDPDDLKMPESPRHRQACDLIGLAAANLRGSAFRVFRDMNWYPSDGGNAIAPDVMLLPSEAWVRPPDDDPDAPMKSYRQDLTGGPPPPVVVEVPSATDGFNSLLAKAHRCRHLGSVVYVVSIDEPRSVIRMGPDDQTPVAWDGRSIEELGGISIGFDGDEIVVELPNGTRAHSDAELLANAQNQAAEARERAERLEQRLRELGIEP